MFLKERSLFLRLAVKYHAGRFYIYKIKVLQAL